MILQALNDYYNRLKDDPHSGIAQYGYAPQNISYAIIINKDGKLIKIQDIRDYSGKKPRPVKMIVPEAVIKTGNIAADFLWGNSSYVLGIDSKGKPERTKKAFQAFKDLIESFNKDTNDEGLNAVYLFLKSWKEEKFDKLQNRDDIIDKNIVFRLEGEKHFIHERPLVKKAWIKFKENDSSALKGYCLITGEFKNIALLHNPIKGIFDPGGQAQKKIVSFNLEAFKSYNKDQNLNAPVSDKAAFSYTTALNHLLRDESLQKIQIGDATIVFWTERASPVENILGLIMNPLESEGADVKPIEDYLKAVRAGKKPSNVNDDSVKFYILGLSPNASRIAVRFWYVDTVEALNRHIGEHFKALSIIRNYDNEKEFPGILQLLRETAVLHKTDNINPLLAGALMRSILTGGRYPATILSAVIHRIRADHDINYYRMALIKAVLIRNFKKEVTEVLNEESTDIAYRLGRLFAVLEKAQEEAIPGANTTIKDRFFSSASSTPRIVFPQLIRLSQHHFRELKGGAKIHKEQLVQSILDGISGTEGFPAFLRLEEQGMFALGYYHQRKTFFLKKSADQPSDNKE